MGVLFLFVCLVYVLCLEGHRSYGFDYEVVVGALRTRAKKGR